MVQDKYGRIEWQALDIIKVLYQDPEIDTSNISLSKKDFLSYLEACKKCGVSNSFSTLSEITVDLEEFDKSNQQTWFVPEEYLHMDIETWLLSQCSSDEQRQRVAMELKEYEKFNFATLLNIAKYLVDVFRKNQIVWGVGRGSSVASYCLYLIGLHKVDSLKYNLDIGEFLK
jgi:DNA polymerase III alpha subunit